MSRRDRVKRFKGLVPNTFTMGSVVCGFLAILSAFEGQITTACWLVILAAFLDALDGKIARFSGTSSQFGVELDSLADFLSFGIAPAVIAYVAHLQYMGRWGWVIGIVYIMASSYRLARYNVTAELGLKKNFVGLPIPMAASTQVTFIIFSYYIWGGLEYGEYLVSLMILCAALMVTQIEYDVLPENFSTRSNRLKLVFVIIAALAALIKPRLLLFPIFSLYIIIGLVKELYRLFYLGVDYMKKHQERNRDIMENNDVE